MKELEFYKYSGHGNDFIIIDNWDALVSEADMPKLAKLACRHKLGIGADGLIYINAGPDDVDFAWRFFHADGSEDDLSGNGARCTAHLANQLGIAPSNMAFSGRGGTIEALVIEDNVTIKMPKIGRSEGAALVEVDGHSHTYHRLNLGIGHAVAWAEDLDRLPVAKLGRAARNHPAFSPDGANLNFAKVIGENRLALRSYVKGAEDETLSCGSGAVAAVLLAAAQKMVTGPVVTVLTKSGEELIVNFQGEPEAPSKVFLEGPVRYIFSGQMRPDLFKA